MGPYQFNPQVSVSYEYRSNIFLTPQDTEGNATTGAGSVLINPVVKFKLDGSTIKVLKVVRTMLGFIWTIHIVI